METVIPNIASRYLQRRVLLLSLIPLGLLFLLTAALARSYHVREEGLVREWYEKGDKDLSAGQPSRAVEDFRNALAYDPENALVQPRLAKALLADGRIAEAKDYFQNLWDRAPGSGEVNLALAHISILTGDPGQAARYFRGAVYGSWEKDPVGQRRNARLELCDFLIEHGSTGDARAEIAGLAADIPPDDGDLHDRVGNLYLSVDEPDRALREFEAALRTNERQDKWLADAGKAAYASGDYGRAQAFLVRAVRENRTDETSELLNTARVVLSTDPFLPGLSDNEQANRSWRAFQQALKRLQSCSTAQPGEAASAALPSDWQTLNNDIRSLKMRVNPDALRRQSQLRQDVMQLVFRVEELTSRNCGTPETADQALILIAKKHSGSNL